MSATNFNKERFEEICIPYNELQQGKELGSGSFGTVRLGRYQHMDVAIKELFAKHLPAKAEKEFEQEALVMKDLRHSNVVLLYGVCIDPNRCLVMEYCAHGSLYNLLQSNQQIPESKLLTWAAEISKGLNYLHTRKQPILHRDLKSPNVLINEHNCAKIADFGLSRIKSSSNSTATLKGKSVGTVRWMAPEIMEAEKGTTYTKAADVYSYGMIAWELATRTIPYEGITKEMPFMMKILQGKREELPPNTPRPLKQVITGCWKQTPEERLPLSEVIQILDNPSSQDFSASHQYGGLGSIPPSSNYSDGYGEGLGSVPSNSTSHGGYSPSSYSGAPAPHVTPQSSASSSSSHQTPYSKPIPAPTPHVTIPEMAFGKAKWNQYFGDIGVEPPLPPNIEQILNSECIFWPGKKVQDTHILVLVPQTVNGKAFHLNSLAKLIKKPKAGNKTEYKYYDSDVKKKLGKKSTSSHWVLLTRDVIPDSRNKKHNDQKALVASHAQKSKIPYALPTALETATAILMEHVQTGNRLYADDPLTYTRCQEKVHKNQWPAAIGGFAAGGLVVDDFNRDGWCDDFSGVAGARKL